MALPCNLGILWLIHLNSLHFLTDLLMKMAAYGQLTLQSADIDTAVEGPGRAEGKSQEWGHKKTSTFRGPRSISGELSPTQAAGMDVTHRQKLDHVPALVLDLRCVNKS